ncbi:bifunctional ornithine acetyltransferase/N-acetylglutamate synthase [Robertmurraya sp. DFI.2.37]|uniref:bifunctional ornithine acetyltransferase/N-acetylglutamate synthase n=1 Tax=Robertmurraya sp. DFI.2.37 TaxID=3031819 RepID=UPI0012487E09|nr:bifunctional ornithine acetyltransferase/N-acetylglutamate synthase [Robertmurraya sp. DFI.2.37]MDF1507419.1 bifunctional ornithine acetyltransferase/N-acetylglutamate synthase [Robertmurraya sp. DFI.2.37]
MGTLTKVAKIIEIENGSILSAQGFHTGGIHAGLRYAKKDVGMIFSEVPAESAAVYTLHDFQAAPIAVTKESISHSGKLQAVVVNSACANACTGEQGLKDAYEMRELAAQKVQVEQYLVAVASTGVIGEYMKMDKIKKGIEQIQLGNASTNADDFQTAILTTDTCMKKCGFQAEIDGKIVHMGGAAKGSGMIHPNMATMLGFITTDANISSENLQVALREVTDDTFNQITVDGDTSTNDMVLVMANGLAENQLLSPSHPEWEVFLQLLNKTCASLAKQIAKDGEGATKLVEVHVTGAYDEDDARKIAKQIVGSNLVKTAIYGADANWGRIIGAIGQADTKAKADKVTISIGPVKMLDKSEISKFSEEEASGYLKGDFIEILVDLHMGDGSGTAWGCDLTYDYVKINASYRT